MSEPVFLMAVFCTTYTKLLRAEAHALGHLDNSIPDMVGMHNTFEQARNEIVETYLPFKTVDVAKRG